METQAGAVEVGPPAHSKPERDAAETYELLQKNGVKFDPQVWDVIGSFGDYITYRCRANGLLFGTLHIPDGPEWVCMQRVVIAGSRQERPGSTGWAHFLEHMAFKGDEENYNGRFNVWNLIERRGGQMNAMTWDDGTLYYFFIPSEMLLRALDIEAGRARAPHISDEDVATEMKVVRNEMERDATDYRRIMMEQMKNAVFQDHPYSRSTIGNRNDIENVTALGLKRFLKTFYTSDQTLCTAIGYIPNQTRLLDQAARTLATIPPPALPRPLINTDEPVQTGERVIQFSRPSQEYMVTVAYKIPRAHHEDAAALSLLADTVSSLEQSVLRRKLVHTHMVATVSAGVYSLRDAGILFITATIPKQKLEEQKTLLVRDPYSQMCEKMGVASPNSECIIAVGYSKMVESVIRATMKQMGIAALAKEHQVDLELFREPMRSARKRLRDDPVQLSQSIGTAFVNGDWKQHFIEQKLYDRVTYDDLVRVAATWCTDKNTTVVRLIPDDDYLEGTQRIDTTPTARRDFGGEEFADLVLRAKKEEHGASFNSEDLVAGGDELNALTNREVVRLPLTDSRRIDQRTISIPRSFADAGAVNTAYLAHTLDEKRVLVVGVMPSGGTLCQDEDATAADLCFRNEVAIMTAAMLGRGTVDKTYENIEELESKYAMSVAFSPRKHSVLLSLAASPEHINDALELLLEQLTKPSWPEDQFDMIRTRAINALRASKDDLGDVAARRASEYMWEEQHPNRVRDPDNVIEALKRITMDDLRDFWRTEYVPYYTSWAIASGSGKLEPVFAELTSSLNAWYTGIVDRDGRENLPIVMTPPTANEPYPTTKHASPQRFDLVVPEGKKEVAIVLVGRRTATTRACTTPDERALMFATQMIGESFTSRLNGFIRDTEGITYGIGAGLATRSDVEGEEAFYIKGTFNPSLVAQGLRDVRTVLAWTARDGLYLSTAQSERSENAFPWLDDEPYYVEEYEMEWALQVLQRMERGDLPRPPRFTPELESDILYSSIEARARELWQGGEEPSREEKIARVRVKLESSDAQTRKEINDFILRARSELGQMKRKTIKGHMRGYMQNGIAYDIIDAVTYSRDDPPLHLAGKNYEHQAVTEEQVQQAARENFALDNDRDIVQIVLSSVPEDNVEKVKHTAAISDASSYVPSDADIDDAKRRYEVKHKQ